MGPIKRPSTSSQSAKTLGQMILLAENGHKEAESRLKQILKASATCWV